MTVKLVLEFPDLQSADAVLHRLAARGLPESAAAPAQQRAEASAVSASPAESVPAAPLLPTAEAPKRRGRRSKAEIDAAKQAAKASAEIADQMQPADSAPVTPQTKEAAMAAFKALHEAKGMDACWTVLQRNGAQRFSEVLERLYPQFIKDCKDAIAGKDLTAAA